MSDIEIRQLTIEDAKAYQAIRLEMLKKSPEAFGDSYEVNLSYDIEFYIDRIRSSFIVGAFDGINLIATAGYFIQAGLKASHKAFLWGVYVKEEYRGQALSYKLTLKVLDGLPPTVSLIQTGVVMGNLAAETTYKKAGFARWAIEEKALNIDGVYHDEIHMVKFLKEE